MAKYFKILEIDEDTFEECTGEELDCCQLAVPLNGAVFVAVDDDEEYEITVPLDLFERGGAE